MIQDVIESLEVQFKETIDQLGRELGKIRTGRANLSMLDSVRVDYYGNPSPLNQIATMKVADPRLITISPWEKSLLGDIERAIGSANLGLNPSNDGVIIRVPIPALTGERRQELSKQARKVAEDHKISLRNQRRDANDTVKDLEKEKEITEDDMHRAYADINQLTEKYTKQIDVMVEKKIEEISEV